MLMAESSTCTAFLMMQAWNNARYAFVRALSHSYFITATATCIAICIWRWCALKDAQDGTAPPAVSHAESNLRFENCQKTVHWALANVTVHRRWDARSNDTSDARASDTHPNPEPLQRACCRLHGKGYTCPRAAVSHLLYTGALGEARIDDHDHMN